MTTRPAMALEIAAASTEAPTARALEFDRRWSTWADLAAAMATIDALVDTHVGAPVTQPPAVGVLVRNRPVHVAALLAVLRRGGSFVVLNPSRGAQSVRTDLAELGLGLVLGAGSDVEPLVGACPDTALVALDGLDAEPDVRYAPAAPTVGPTHPGVAVRMLTSGTTGPPKRIDLTYAALLGGLSVAKSLESGRSVEPTRPRGVAVVNAPLAHIGGVFRVLQCVLDRRPFVYLAKFEVQSWLRAVRSHRPRTASLVPTALRMVLAADPDPADLASLEAVTSGTAPLAAEDADAFTDRFGIPVLTSYAATEFAGGVAGWTLADHREHWRAKRGSVGRAQPGCALRVVDETTGAVLRADQPGLLEVKPAQLGPDIDWVRTTDLARIDADGFLWILGRADQAIIRGGFKVLPDRVRAVLELHPGVHAAVVFGVPDQRLGAVPVALLEGTAEVADIRAEAARSLAGYELPTEIHLVPELPRTVSGKVDLTAAAALRAELVAP